MDHHDRDARSSDVCASDEPRVAHPLLRPAGPDDYDLGPNEHVLIFIGPPLTRRDDEPPAARKRRRR